MRRRGVVTAALLLLVVALAAIPLVLGLGSGEEPFSGTDSQATTTITELDPGYEPWFTSLVELPSGEVESGLFALQAALGAGVLGYAIGVLRTRSVQRRTAAAAGAPAPAADAPAPAAGAPAARPVDGPATDGPGPAA